MCRSVTDEDTIPTTNVALIGLFKIVNLSPLLNVGTASAFCQNDGTSPESRGFLQILAKGSAITSFSLLPFTYLLPL